MGNPDKSSCVRWATTLVFTINHVKTVRNESGFHVNLVRASRSKIDIKTVRRSRSSDNGFSQGFYIIFRGYVNDDIIDHVTDQNRPDHMTSQKETNHMTDHVTVDIFRDFNHMTSGVFSSCTSHQMPPGLPGGFPPIKTASHGLSPHQNPFPRAVPPSKYPREDDRPWEIASPGIPCLRVAPRVVPPLKFHQYILTSLHKHYFLCPFEKCVHKNLRIKI